eukprot:GHVU01005092.1.p1 GENE.GHVU01005092.1~~GHVU01005092.1.p1  ORF type:complete len:699 (+),score=60.70 GHVU01005092.1:313-2097(+)
MCTQCDRIRFEGMWKTIVVRCQRHHTEGASTCNHQFLSKAMVEKKLTECKDEWRKLRLQVHNLGGKVRRLEGTVDMHTRIMKLLGQNDIPRVCAVLRVQLSVGASPARVLTTLENAISGSYKVRSYTASDRDLCMLILRLGGPRLVSAMQEAGGLAGYSTVRRWLKDIVQFTFCHAGFDRSIVAGNITAAFAQPRKAPKVAMCDEIAVTPKLDVKISDELITGVCWEHHKRINLRFTVPEVFDNVLKQADEGHIHLAREALVFAVGDLGHTNYHAVPVLALGSCKTGGRERQKEIIGQFVEVWHQVAERDNGPLWAFGTDGDPCRRGACDDIFREVDVEEDFGDVLRPLGGLDIKCSRTGAVVVSDFKHMGKRMRGWITSSKRTIKIGDWSLTPALTEQWLLVSGVQNVKRMTKPTDKMRVAVAFDLLKAISEATPEAPVIGTRPNTFAPYLRVMKVVCDCMGAPMSATLGLQDQLTKLSLLSHVVGFLFSLHGREFMHSQLVHDIHCFVKAAFFLTARGQAHDDEFELFLSLLGSDSLEELFGTVRTVDHNVNVSTCDLETKLSIATQVRDISSRHREWSPPDRCCLPTGQSQ